MAFDYFTGEFTPGTHQLGTHQVYPVVAEMEHRDTGYIATEAYWVDLDRNVYVDGDASLMSEPEMRDEFEQLVRKKYLSYVDQDPTTSIDDLGFQHNFLRVACIKVPELSLSGVILDLSDANLESDENEVGARIHRERGPAPGGIIAESPNPIEVCAWIGNEVQLELIEERIALPPFSVELCATFSQIAEDCFAQIRREE